MKAGQALKQSAEELLAAFAAADEWGKHVIMTMAKAEADRVKRDRKMQRRAALRLVVGGA